MSHDRLMRFIDPLLREEDLRTTLRRIQELTEKEADALADRLDAYSRNGRVTLSLLGAERRDVEAIAA